MTLTDASTLTILVAMECATRSKEKIIHKCYVNQLSIKLYAIVINRRRGLYWFYKREARGRVAPEAERLLNQYRPTALVNKYCIQLNA